MAKKKKKSNGPIIGFLLLLLLIGGTLYFYNNTGSIPQGDNLKKEFAKALDNAKEEATEVSRQLTDKVGELTTKTSDKVASSSISNKLEIPLMTIPREEIKLTRTGYTLSYNPHFKTPNWVAWELTRKETTGNEERKNKFIPDPDLPEPRAVHSDYTNTGYDRGHMAPAADMKWSEKAMSESFYMSNICPQNQKLNRDDWGDLEDICRRWAKKYGTIHIACGPIYDKKYPKRIGRNKVAVPDRFYKVVLIYNRKKPIAMGFLFDNKANHQAIQKYMVTVDSIEKITGMDFFSKVPDEIENRIEAIVPQLPSY